jgi:mannose-6-phosphate isomerase class I
MGLTAERHPTTQTEADGPRRKRRQAAAAQSPREPATPDEDAWLMADAESDARALLSLSDFLSHRGLRSHGSACQDAIDAISRLQEEVRQLKTAAQQR